MPQGHTDRDKQDGRKSSPQGYSVEPCGLLTAVHQVRPGDYTFKGPLWASNHLVKTRTDNAGGDCGKC
jgi:hypothetical protein